MSRVFIESAFRLELYFPLSRSTFRRDASAIWPQIGAPDSVDQSALRCGTMRSNVIRMQSQSSAPMSRTVQRRIASKNLRRVERLTSVASDRGRAAHERRAPCTVDVVSG